MLSHLMIENFAIIEKCILEFSAGMTVITGETGAGKSIVLDALGLVLGARAESSVIRSGTVKCDIQAIFNITAYPSIQAWLSSRHLEQDLQDCYIRRVISAEGRSRSFINHHAVPLQLLKELGNLLVTLHGQHEHQALLSKDSHRQWLDSYSHHEKYLKQINQSYQDYIKTKKLIQDYQQKIIQRDSRLDFLRYQLGELILLEQYNLTAEKILLLEKDYKHFSQSKEYRQSYEAAAHLLSTEIMPAIHKAQNFLPKDHQLGEYFDTALIQLNEALHDINHYNLQSDISAEKLLETENLLSQLYALSRKHQVKTENLPDIYEKLQQELNALETLAIEIDKLNELLEKIRQNYFDVSHKLSVSRKKTAQKMSAEIELFLKELAMENARFSIQLIKHDKSDAIHSYGLEKVEFLISPNPGQSLQPLAKIASGGELSRISLAIELITSRDQMLPVLIFDEVDTGISGAAAMKVGKLLKKLSQQAQLICITHLPQIAAQAEHHIYIHKKSNTEKNTTTAHIDYLNSIEKIQAIARLLGGDKITHKALSHARELVEN